MLFSILFYEKFRGVGMELRKLKISDLEKFHKQINDKEISKNISEIKYPVSRKIAESILKDLIEDNKKKNKEVFVIEINKNIAGIIGLTKIEKKHKAEIYYWIGKEFRGKGIMSKALKKITLLGFKKYKLRRIYCTLLTTNKASSKLLEKCDFRKEGILKKNALVKGKYLDNFLYPRVK